MEPPTDDVDLEGRRHEHDADAALLRKPAGKELDVPCWQAVAVGELDRLRAADVLAELDHLLVAPRRVGLEQDVLVQHLRRRLDEDHVGRPPREGDVHADVGEEDVLPGELRLLGEVDALEEGLRVVDEAEQDVEPLLERVISRAREALAEENRLLKAEVLDLRALHSLPQDDGWHTSRSV